MLCSSSMWACSNVTDIAVRSLALLQLVTLPQSNVRQSCVFVCYCDVTHQWEITALTSWLSVSMSVFLAFLACTWEFSCWSRSVMTFALRDRGMAALPNSSLKRLEYNLSLCKLFILIWSCKWLSPNLPQAKIKIKLTDTETQRQTDRPADRQTDTHTHTHTQLTCQLTPAVRWCPV